MNSLSAVRRAIKFETERQINCLNRGEKLIQSTRRWDVMDRPDGKGSPDGLIGPENADARVAIVAALTSKKPEDVAADPAARLKTAVPQVERLLYDAAKIPGKTIKDRRAAFLDWLDRVQSSKQGDPAQARPKDERARNDAQQNTRSAEAAQPDDVPANQEPIKNEPPARAIRRIGTLAIKSPSRTPNHLRSTSPPSSTTKPA